MAIEYVIIPSVALFASLLTFFSGFGLGTLLLPAFATVFPIPVAVTMTAVVHLLNNLFKFTLLGKHTDIKIILNFGLPALFGSFIGAFSLVAVSRIPPLFTYSCWGHIYSVEPLKILIGVLLIVFATIESKEKASVLKLKSPSLVVGGLLSGFFGGISGFQGALRSIFLIHCNLTKEAFIASGVVIACMIDIARIPAYGFSLQRITLENNLSLLALTVVAAFLGAYVGNVFFKKTTTLLLKRCVTVLIYVVSLGLIIGIC